MQKSEAAVNHRSPHFFAMGLNHVCLRLFRSFGYSYIAQFVAAARRDERI